MHFNIFVLFICILYYRVTDSVPILFFQIDLSFHLHVAMYNFTAKDFATSRDSFYLKKKTRRKRADISPRLYFTTFFI